MCRSKASYGGRFLRTACHLPWGLITRSHSLIAISLLLGCREKPLDWYKNDFVAIPRIDGYSIQETKNPFSRDCIFVSEKDSVFDFTVCRFDRDSGEKLDRYLRMEYAYVPSGFAVSHTDSTNHFGNHPSIGHFKVMVDSSVPKRFTIAIHRVESGSNLIGVVSRVKKEFPSDAWFERNKKWRYSWKFL